MWYVHVCVVCVGTMHNVASLQAERPTLCFLHNGSVCETSELLPLKWKPPYAPEALSVTV